MATLQALQSWKGIGMSTLAADDPEDFDTLTDETRREMELFLCSADEAEDGDQEAGETAPGRPARHRHCEQES